MAAWTALSRQIFELRRESCGDEAPNRRLLVDEWSNANELYYRLAEDEARICERVEVMELPGELLQSARTVSATIATVYPSTACRRAWPWSSSTALIVTQPHINLDHVERLQKRLSPRLDLNELFQFCLPLDRKEADIRSGNRDRDAICSGPDRLTSG